MVVAAVTADEVRAWLSAVPDPEIPVLSITDLGIVRDVRVDDGVVVGLAPTYTGCPATEVIEQSVLDALREHGVDEVSCGAPPVAAMDDGLDHGVRSRKTRRLRHCAARRARRQEIDPGRRPARRLPALRQCRHCPREPLRLDAVQGCLALRQLPGTFRILQVPLSPLSKACTATTR